MNYIKAKFPNSTRSYTYRTGDSVKAGDTVVNANGATSTQDLWSVTSQNTDLCLMIIPSSVLWHL